MKRVIICEGKVDGMFFIKLLEKLKFKSGEIRIFNPEDLKKDAKIGKETVEINRFVSKHNKDNFLVKLEGGKDFAVKIYSHIMTYCIREMDLSILMIDLDTGNVDTKIAKLKKIMQQTRKSSTPIELEFEKKKKNNHLHHISAKVSMQQTGQQIGNFELIFFKSSLEQSCGIQKSKIVKDEERMEKINSFIDNENMVDFFSQIIK